MEDSGEEAEEVRRVLRAREPAEYQRRVHEQQNHATFAEWCEVCLKAKSTGSQHRRQQKAELVDQERDDPIIHSDFFYMSESGVSVPHLVIKFSRSGRIAATYLEQKGLTQYGVKFFARFIQQTGVRRFINMSDGEHAM